MEQLLQEFETPVVDKAGTIYRVFLYGRSRPADTWQGWLVFERAADGTRYPTDVETTQPNAEAVLYWATGLTDAYFDGALDRALNPHRHNPRAIPTPAPIVGGDSATRRYRLGMVERAILDCFRKHGTTRLLMRTLTDELGYAHADIVRALEDLEKLGRMVVRETQEGNDWIFLTETGESAVRPRDELRPG
jgi:DNA-binding MarR family transcriptional regulator